MYMYTTPSPLAQELLKRLEIVQVRTSKAPRLAPRRALRSAPAKRVHSPTGT